MLLSVFEHLRVRGSAFLVKPVLVAAAKRLGHANASVTTRHYARSRDGQDVEIAKGLNADHEKAQRARARKAKNVKPIKDDVARKLHDEKQDPARSDDQGV
ncbi:hypothetical protein ABT075_05625 [Streptomyces sp. NPDC002677]|uniref:hypothetical protein n=1 Tax=Streptomyces sp. NPDC002677 TaxID=3154774 RepID=UPI0033318E4C